ncbi:hypothetical protein AKJ09_03219 [Labilithrix luteola]|uniref:Uncharacterized protein n=1 Tax=Labilithrix luteola TaxID=1391654 RepID=A0A0K1PSN8_9BACT|nr:hypothetical protein AKJ09_03219 [Labilithrix luteola]
MALQVTKQDGDRASSRLRERGRKRRHSSSWTSNCWSIGRWQHKRDHNNDN